MVCDAVPEEPGRGQRDRQGAPRPRAHGRKPGVAVGSPDVAELAEQEWASNAAENVSDVVDGNSVSRRTR